MEPGGAEDQGLGSHSAYLPIMVLSCVPFLVCERELSQSQGIGEMDGA